MNFYFCETCGKRITDRQILEDLGRDKKLKGVYCKDCAVGVMTMEMNAINIEQLAKTKPKSSSPVAFDQTEAKGTSRKASGIIRSHDVPHRYPACKTSPATKEDKLPVLLAIGAVIVVAGVIAFATVKSSNTPKDRVSHAAQAEVPARLLRSPLPTQPLTNVPVQPSIIPTPVTPAKTVEVATETPPNSSHAETALSVPSLAGSESRSTVTLVETNPQEPAAQATAIATIDKGHEQFTAILNELAPILRQNHFMDALEVLDSRRRDPAFADAAELIAREKSDIEDIQAMRNRAMEALRAKVRSVVTLKNGTMTGRVKAEANKDGIVLALKDGPELIVATSQLDVTDVDNLLSPETGAGKADDLRRRGILLMAAGELAKAEDYFAKARDAGAGTIAPYLERIAVLKMEVKEAAASNAWKKAEGLFASKNWKAAKQAYETLAHDYAGSAVVVSNTVTLKMRLECIDEALGRGREVSLDLGGGVKLELVLIPAGEFEMGSNDGEKSEKPVHKVKISRSFYMGKYVVTQAQYAKVMGSNPSNFRGDNLPVEMVNYVEAAAFCKKAGNLTGKSFRLPTEAEWEYACHAGTKTKFNTGDNDGALEQAAWFGGNSEGKTHPVGQKKPNAWGLYDMHGNVWHWCQDWYEEDYYGKSVAENPQGPPRGAYRVLRGGSWNATPTVCRSASRWYDLGNPYYHVGFRVVVPASGTP